MKTALIDQLLSEATEYELNKVKNSMESQLKNEKTPPAIGTAFNHPAFSNVYLVVEYSYLTVSHCKAYYNGSDNDWRERDLVANGYHGIYQTKDLITPYEKRT